MNQYFESPDYADKILPPEMIQEIDDEIDEELQIGIDAIVSGLSLFSSDWNIESSEPDIHGNMMFWIYYKEDPEPISSVVAASQDDAEEFFFKQMKAALSKMEGLDERENVYQNSNQ